jgi:hypothetical protein
VICDHQVELESRLRAAFCLGGPNAQCRMMAQNGPLAIPDSRPLCAPKQTYELSICGRGAAVGVGDDQTGPLGTSRTALTAVHCGHEIDLAGGQFHYRQA